MSAACNEGLPMRASENRARYNRDKLCYPGDLTDEEWGHIELMIPPAKKPEILP